MLSGMHISLPRLKLIEIITEQKANLQQKYVTQVEELKTVMADLVSVPVALREWHADIAAGLASGIYSVKADGTILASTADDGEEPPEKPSTSRKGTTKKALLGCIDQCERNAVSDVARFDSALTLLEFATDVDVNVPVRDYEQLLSTRPREYYY